MSDPWDDEDTKAWLKHVRAKVAPMVEGSNVFISIAPPQSAGPDPKFCVELGYAIMFNKPIVVVADKREDVPSKLWFIAEQVILGDVRDPEVQATLMKAIQREP